MKSSNYTALTFLLAGAMSLQAMESNNNNNNLSSIIGKKRSIDSDIGAKNTVTYIHMLSVPIALNTEPMNMNTNIHPTTINEPSDNDPGEAVLDLITERIRTDISEFYETTELILKNNFKNGMKWIRKGMKDKALTANLSEISIPLHGGGLNIKGAPTWVAYYKTLHEIGESFYPDDFAKHYKAVYQNLPCYASNNNKTEEYLDLMIRAMALKFNKEEVAKQLYQAHRNTAVGSIEHILDQQYNADPRLRNKINELINPDSSDYKMKIIVGKFREKEKKRLTKHVQISTNISDNDDDHE